jgi:Tol biopolymer transport system component
MLRILLTLTIFFSFSSLRQEDEDFPIIFRSGLVTNPFEGTATYQLFRLDPETGDIQTFETLQGLDITRAVWSPDGTKIAFTDDVTRSAGYLSEGDLYVMNADGSNLQKLTDKAQPIDRIEWSADGQSIGYSLAIEPGMVTDVIVISASTGEEIIRTAGRGFALSPDNNLIAFTQSKPDVEYLHDLYVLRDGEPEQIETGTGHIQSFKWSPDGSHLTFVYYELVNNQPVSDIYTMVVEGDESVTNLTQTGKVSGPLTYSPDGSQIAYFDGIGDLYLMNADGSEQRMIYKNVGEGVRDATPKWSPDGTQIAFEITSTASTLPYNLYTLHIYDLETDTVTDLSPNLDPEGSYSWSPDSEEIVFMGKTEGSVEIYIVSADGTTAPHSVTNTPDMFDVQPLWQPEG